MSSALRNILTSQTLAGEVALLAFDSHSGVLVRTPSSALIFDPLGIEVEEVTRADAIVVTHEHSDHLDVPRVRALQRKTGAAVITTPFAAGLLRGVPAERVLPLTTGDSVWVGDVRVRACPSEHPGRQPLSFLLETAGGVRVYHPSDSDPFPQMAELARDRRPDLLLYLGSSLEKALRIVELVNPRVLLSRHLDPLQINRSLHAAPNGTSSATLRSLQIYRYP